MTASLILLAGMLLAAGPVCLAVLFLPAQPHLAAALDRVGGDRSVDTDIAPPALRRSERLGHALYRRSPVPLSAGQRSALRLQDKSIAEFYTDKAVMAMVGAGVPLILGILASYVAGGWSVLPAGGALVGTVVGFFVPDLLLRRAAATTQAGASEALLVFMDLVTLERLTNASATQALQNAAGLSEIPLFVQIRAALERARLEQQSPYAEVRRLAEQLRLPELADVADVMQLDDSGASLSGALMARVRELRDAHLTREQIKAAAAAEGMTIYMTLPALIFGLIFLVAALLRIVFG